MSICLTVFIMICFPLTETLAPFVQAYDDVMNGPFAQFVNLSNQIGGDVKTQVSAPPNTSVHMYACIYHSLRTRITSHIPTDEGGFHITWLSSACVFIQVAMVKTGFDAQRAFLVKASKCKQPAQVMITPACYWCLMWAACKFYTDHVSLNIHIAFRYS